MQRRESITLLGSTATLIPFSARAQQSQAPLIGILNAASAKSTASSYEAFRAELRQLGYVEGRNIRFEYRYADGFLGRLPALAEELVRLNPKIIVSGPLPRQPRGAQRHSCYPNRDGDRRGPSRLRPGTTSVPPRRQRHGTRELRRRASV